MKQRNITASIFEIKEIPVATQTLCKSSNLVGLVGTLSESGVSGKSKIAASTGSMYTSTYETTQYLSRHTR